MSSQVADLQNAPAEAGLAVREATCQEANHWDDLVGRFVNCRIFHKKSWLAHLEAFSGAKALYLIVEKNGEIVACLPGFLAKLGPLKLFGSPREGWQAGSMGPVFDANRITTRELLASVIPFLERQYGVLHIEMVSAHLDAQAMSDLGFSAEQLFTYRVPLFPGDEEKVLRGVHSRTRTYIRKTPKTGLTATVETSESFVDEFYEQTKAVFARRGKAVPFNRTRVLQLFRHLSRSGNLLALAVRGPEDSACMATGIFLIDGEEIYLWAWTHRAEYGRYHPKELLTWTAMREAMRRRCVWFDMGGGGGAKLKFGAAPDTSVYRWTRSRYKWLAQCRGWARKGYRWQQSLRGRVGRKAALRPSAERPGVEAAKES